MARKRIGPQLVVRVIDASDLVDNGGEYLLSGNVAVPIAIEDNVVSAIGGPIHDAVYVVTDSEITSGKYRIQGGAAQAVVDSGNFVSPPRKVGGGRDVTPVYIVSGSFAEEEIIVPTYSEKVLATQPANLIGYWPLDETSGTNADNLEGAAARDGTFARDVSTMTTGVGIGDGNTAPLFDGTADICDIYSASFSTAFSGLEGTLSIWMKVLNVGTWTDGVNRVSANLEVDSNNLIRTLQSSTNNRYVNLMKIVGGDNRTNYDAQSQTGWFHAAITWSDSGNEMIDYLDGSGTTITPIGTWVGDLASALTRIGGKSSIFWSGFLAHCAVWDTPLSAAQIAALATV